VTPMFIDWELLLTILSINAIGALGYYFTFSSGQFSMAHGALFVIGGYTAASLATVAPQLPMIVYLLAGFVVAAAIGGILALALSRLRGLYFAVATLAFGGVVTEAIKKIPALGGAFGIGGIPNYTNLAIAATVLVVIVFLVWAFDRSSLYAVHASARIDQDAAVVLGISVRRTRGFAFAIGGGIAGIAGVLYAGMTTVITPANGEFDQSLAFLLMVIIGGANSWRGPILGAVIWTALPELLRSTDEWRMVIFGAAAIALMAWRPQGIIPRRIFGPRSRARFRSRFGGKPPLADDDTGGAGKDAGHESAEVRADTP
jgi:branched-chain amino acid transport system permease protein